jgi:hypothetical protein
VLDEIDARTQAEAAAAVDEAMGAPMPDPETTLIGAYASPIAVS